MSKIGKFRNFPKMEISLSRESIFFRFLEKSYVSEKFSRNFPELFFRKFFWQGSRKFSEFQKNFLNFSETFWFFRQKFLRNFWRPSSRGGNVGNFLWKISTYASRDFGGFFRSRSLGWGKTQVFLGKLGLFLRSTHSVENSTLWRSKLAGKILKIFRFRSRVKSKEIQCICFYANQFYTVGSNYFINWGHIFRPKIKSKI